MQGFLGTRSGSESSAQRTRVAPFQRSSSPHMLSPSSTGHQSIVYRTKTCVLTNISETKRNKQCYYGWLYLSTDSSKLTAIGDGAALLKPSPRWVNAPAPLSLHHSSPQRSLLRSVLESLCSCSSCLFLSRVFNQIASTTNLLSLPHST